MKRLNAKCLACSPKLRKNRRITRSSKTRHLAISVILESVVRSRIRMPLFKCRSLEQYTYLSTSAPDSSYNPFYTPSCMYRKCLSYFMRNSATIIIYGVFCNSRNYSDLPLLTFNGCQLRRTHHDKQGSRLMMCRDLFAVVGPQTCQDLD